MGRQSRRAVFFKILFVIIILLFFYFLGILKPIENLVQTISKPFFQFAYQRNVAIKKYLSAYRNYKENINLIKECEQEAPRADILSANLKLLEVENESLRKQLNFNKEIKTDPVVADVIAKDIMGLERTILINRGEKSGIKKDDPVIAEKGILIGKIIKTNPTTSWVLLINDSQSKIPATVLNREKSLGVIEGGHGISLRMKLIPRHEIIAVGDQIVTSAMEENIPAGLLIGSVAVVENEAYKPFQQAVVTPTVDSAKITIVSVLVK